MSDKLSMPAVDKVQLKVQVKAGTYVRLENMSNKSSVSMSALCGALLDEATAGVEMTTADIARMNEIIAANVERREAAKAKKGIR